MTKYLKHMWQRMEQIFKPVTFQDNLVFDLAGYTNKSITQSELNGDGLLLAVPKHRRSLEKRLSHRFGWPEYHWKPLTPKTNLKLCKTCGHHYEFGTICGKLSRFFITLFYDFESKLL
uniref:Uncharacterized protein n=1 Tax=Trichogramma kaykai TaxID=54128 RepID=A0ABD2X0G9_9HYME